MLSFFFTDEPIIVLLLFYITQICSCNFITTYTVKVGSKKTMK